MMNIGGDAADASYRYKMPKLVTKVEGRGNGIKTVIVNMVEIAKALHCETTYPIQFFGTELGAQSKFDKKTERAIVNGAHMAPDLQQHLTRFIELFILCPTCGLPEVSMKVGKSNIKIDCAACGHNGILPTNHKLVTYILKHPPKGTKSKDKKKKDKKERRKEKKKRQKDKDKGRDEASDDSEDEKEKKKEKKEKKKKDKKKDKKDRKSKEEDVEWFTDTSKEAQEKRKNEEFSSMGGGDERKEAVEQIVAEAKENQAEDSAATFFKIFLAQKERKPKEIVNELRRLQMARAMDDPQKMKLALEGLIDTAEPKAVVEQFKKNAASFELLCKDNAGIFLGCVEHLVGRDAKLMARIPLILQALYEADALEEDAILAWADSPPESSWLVDKEVAVKVRNKAKPFIDWLRNAESDDDSDDE